MNCSNRKFIIMALNNYLKFDFIISRKLLSKLCDDHIIRCRKLCLTGSRQVHTSNKNLNSQKDVTVLPSPQEVSPISIIHSKYCIFYYSA